MISIELLQANHGDSIWCTFIDNDGITRNVLIDSGPGKTYSFKNSKGKIQEGSLLKKINELKADPTKGIIDLLIITHIDDDHIGGFLKWIQLDEHCFKYIGKIWFNSGKNLQEYFKSNDDFRSGITLGFRKGNATSLNQGVALEEYLDENGVLNKEVIAAKQHHIIYGAKFSILSPNDEKLEKLNQKWQASLPDRKTAKKSDYSRTLKELIDEDEFEEDDAVYNGSAISFILEYKNKKLLFLADAHPSDVVEGLSFFGHSKTNKLVVDLVKVSHHGSKNNMSSELLSMIESPMYVISTDGTKHGLPDKQCLARIVKNTVNPKFVFNYPNYFAKIFSDDDYRAAKFLTSYQTQIELADD